MFQHNPAVVWLLYFEKLLPLYTISHFLE